MGAFEHFPYSNSHDLNLDWVLQQVKGTAEAIVTAEEASTAANSAASGANNAAISANNAANDAITATVGAEEATLAAEQATAAAQKIIPFAGKNLCLLGDSVTKGTHATLGKGYADVVKDLCGFSTLTNLAIDYATMIAGGNTIQSQIGTIPADADVICIMGGTNDFSTNSPVGNLGSALTSDFCGAWAKMLQNISTARPNARLFIITPPPRYDVSYLVQNTMGATMKDYVRIIKTIGALYQIPVIDIYNASFDIVQAETKATYMYDGAHPNDAGHAVIGAIVAHALISGFGNTIENNYPLWLDIGVGKAVTLDNGWVQDTQEATQYHVDKTGRAHIKGSVKSGTAGASIMTLPAFMRPNNLMVIPACDKTTGAPIGMVLTSAGTLLQFGSTPANGINFNGSWLPKV